MEKENFVGMEATMNAGQAVPLEAMRGNAGTPQWIAKGDEEVEVTSAGKPFETHPAVADQPVSEGVAGARDLLLMEHLPTVRYIARRIHERLPQHVDLDDLVSAGVIGLIDAFSKFDHNKKVQFKSYAQFRIRGAILDSLRTLDWSPRELRRKGEPSKRRSARSRRELDALPPNRRSQRS